MVRRTHHCRRCGTPIDPGDVYAAVDILDAEGRVRVLLCQECGGDLRAFIDDGGTETPESGGGGTDDGEAVGDADADERTPV